jgi:hypothetical protein
MTEKEFRAKYPEILTGREKRYPDSQEDQFLSPLAILTLNLFKTALANPKIVADSLHRPLMFPAILTDPFDNNMMGDNNPLNTLGGFAIGSSFFDSNYTTSLGQIHVTQAQRTPTWVYQASCTTVAVTPIVAAVAGKRHRVLGGVIIWGAGLAAAGTETLEIQDVAGHFGGGGLIFANYLPIAASLTGLGVSVTPLTNLGNGFLTAAVNTAINVVLSVAVTAGAISVTLWGDDE